MTCDERRAILAEMAAVLRLSPQDKRGGPDLQQARNHDAEKKSRARAKQVSRRPASPVVTQADEALHG